MKKTSWQLLHEHSPAVCRLFARRRIASTHVVAMSNREVAIGSGLTLSRVIEISNQITWAGITIDEAEKFVSGCQFDPFSYQDRNRKQAYIRSCRNTPTKFKFLRSHPAWETELKPLIKRLQSHLAC